VKSQKLNISKYGGKPQQVDVTASESPKRIRNGGDSDLIFEKQLIGNRGPISRKIKRKEGSRGRDNNGLPAASEDDEEKRDSSQNMVLQSNLRPQTLFKESRIQSQAINTKNTMSLSVNTNSSFNTMRLIWSLIVFLVIILFFQIFEGYFVDPYRY